jgi:hypothetical protein
MNESQFTLSELQTPYTRVPRGRECQQDEKEGEVQQWAKLPPRPFPIVLEEPVILPQSKAKDKYTVHHDAHSLQDGSHVPEVLFSTISNSKSERLQKEREVQLRSELEISTLVALEQYQQRVSQLEHELVSQKDKHSQLHAQYEERYHIMTQEKDSRYQELASRYESELKNWRQQLHDKDRHYVALMSEQERNFEEKLRDCGQQYQQQIDILRARAAQDQELKELAEQARLEAKEESAKKLYEKKLRKMEKLIEQTIEHYNQKELLIHGALDESRREAAQLKATIEAKEQQYKDHLFFQDKKLIQLQQQIDNVNMLTQVADTWRDSARDLASYVIRTCATVGELPYDFLAMQAPGSVYAKDVFADPTARDYNKSDRYVNFTRGTHVAVNRSQVTRALRLSKVSALLALYCLCASILHLITAIGIL